MFVKRQFAWALASVALQAVDPKASQADPAPGSAQLAAQVDEVVRRAMARQGIPGLSLAVVREGKLMLAQAYGMANLEWQAPATPETVYQVQSITKSFTATGIMLLVEEGRIELDRPVGAYLEGTPESWRTITIRHLLTHTSGIKDFINDPTVSLRLEVTEAEVLEATAPRPLNFAPGEKYAYSNTNYHLLAMIIRKLTGKSYGDFLSERILRPSEMSDTRVISLSEIIPHRAAGYLMAPNGWRNGQFIAETVLAYGGGGLRSTVLDLARWDAALDAEKLLKKSSLDHMWTPATFNSGKASAYGFGWGVRSVRGHRCVSHTGGHMTGFSTIFSRFPDDRLTVIVFTNCANIGLDRLMQRVAGVFLPDLAPTDYQPIEDQDPHIAARLKAMYAQWVSGEPHVKQFAPELAEEFSPDEIDYRVGCYGPLESLVLVERVAEGDLLRYRYLAKFPSRQLVIAVALSKDDQITEFRFEPE